MADFLYTIERRSFLSSGQPRHVSVAGFNWLKDAETFFKSLDHSKLGTEYWMYETTSARHLVRTSDDEL